MGERSKRGGGGVEGHNGVHQEGVESRSQGVQEENKQEGLLTDPV